MSTVPIKPAFWDPTGIYESQSHNGTYRLVLGEKAHKLGRWDLPKGKWFYGKMDSNGAFSEDMSGNWGEEWNNKVICRNFDGSYAFELTFHENGITLKDGKCFKKISGSSSSLKENYPKTSFQPRSC